MPNVDLNVEAVPAVDARRQGTIDRVRRAALELLLARGLDVTMDEIAEAAEIGRRTLFRHFASREQLLASALEQGIARYSSHLPSFEGDWTTWLRALCNSAHAMHAGYGPGYWELMHRAELPAELAAVENDRRKRRRKAMVRIAQTLWQETGGAGAAPKVLVATVASHLSARFTAAVVDEGGQSWQMAADIAFDAIHGALTRATRKP
jgi:AcrR family transcriptional regulator